MDGKPRQRLRRLATMSPAEAFDRLRQGWSARLDLLCARMGFSLESKLRQASGQPGRFFFDSRCVPLMCTMLKNRLPQEADEILARAQRICRHRFDLLGYEDLDYGSEIDWHCDRVHNKRAPQLPWFKIRYLDFDEVGDSKVTWELNRHQHFVTLAKAYRLTGENRFFEELLGQWDHWQRSNPYPIGINWASALEVAFRSLSWVWTYHLLADSAALPPDFRVKWLRALATNGHHIEQHLSTYFSPNTHLLGEAVGLFFIGTLCPEIRAAERWKLRGWRMVQQEAGRQVLSDGLHFERSTYYHVYALEFFLHARILAAVNDMPIPPAFDQAIEKMLNALCELGGAGPVPQRGDDDGGRVFDGRRNRAEHMVDPLASGAAIFGRSDFWSVAGGLREETLWLLGEAGISTVDALGFKARARASSVIDGVHVLLGRDSQLVFDAGSQGALTGGHSHADALSVTLAANGRTVLIDPGTLEYVGQQRNLFRGTAAHNTLRVDEQDQSAPRGPFGWAKLPRVCTERRINGKTFDLVAASHDGYARRKSPVIHTRWIFSPRSGFYFVRDVVLGAGEHRLELFWHLANGLLPTQDGEFAESDGSGLCLLTAETAGWSREVLEDCWSPAYGIKSPTCTLRLAAVTQLPTEFVTVLVPGKVEEGARTAATLDPLGLTRLGAYRYVTAEAEHVLCFAREPGAWQAGAWGSDAEFLYFMASRDGSHSKLICCNATTVSFAGRQIVSSPKSMLRCEIICTGRQFETFSSEPGATVNEAAARMVSIESQPATTTSSGLFSRLRKP